MEDMTINKLREDFLKSKKVLQAIGDETRQSIFLALMEAPCTVGMRVGEITKRTHLSRPAVSHHLKILKSSGLVELRKEGTMNFYSINIRDGLEDLSVLLTHLNDYKNKIRMEKKENA